MLTDFSFTSRERKFFKAYIKLLTKYHKNPQKLKIFLEIKAMDLEIENPSRVLEKFEEFLRLYLFFESLRPRLEENLHVPKEALSALKEYPYFVEYECKYNFPEEAIYRGFKWREPLLLAGGNDGLVRIWKYQNGHFTFLRQLGEKNDIFPAYELYKDHLFYASGGTLIVYYIPSGKTVAKIDTGQKITALNLEGEKLFLYKRIGNIAIKQNIEIENGKVLFGPADPITPNTISSGESNIISLNDKLVRVKDGKIIVFTADEKALEDENTQITKLLNETKEKLSSEKSQLQKKIEDMLSISKS